MMMMAVILMTRMILQELDEAARRRLVKRLYIPLPEGAARRRIVTNLLKEERHSLTEEQVEEVVARTEGYSGADMANLCKEAAMGPVRSLDFGAIETMEVGMVLEQRSTSVKHPIK